MSPRSTLSASESVKWKSSFSLKRPPDVGKIITGRPNFPNQRNSISRPREGLNQRPYSRYMRQRRMLYDRFHAQETNRAPLRDGGHLPLGADRRHQLARRQ